MTCWAVNNTRPCVKVNFFSTMLKNKITNWNKYMNNMNMIPVCTEQQSMPFPQYPRRQVPLLVCNVQICRCHLQCISSMLISLAFIFENIHCTHDDVIKLKHFPRYWLFVRGIHQSPVNSPHKGQCRGALMFTLICTRISGWINNCEAGDLIRNRAHYDVIIMDYRWGVQF